MSQFSVRSRARKSIALAAVFASSVASVVDAGVAAHATTYGDPGSPVTIMSGNTVNIVGGGTVVLPAGAHDVSWAGQGGRLAFVGADNGVYTADYDGSHIIQIATPASAYGGARSHTAWDAESHYVMWGEGPYNLYRALANGGDMAPGRSPSTIFQRSGRPFPAWERLAWPDAAADRSDTVVFENGNGSGAGVGLETWVNGTQVFTQVVPITNTYPIPVVDTQPTISPDGKTIVFVKMDANGVKQLFATTQGAAGWGTPFQVTFDGHVDHIAPTFEVDGKTVVYTSTDNTTPATVSPMTGTYTADVTQAVQASGSAPGSNPSTVKVSGLVGSLAVRTDSKARVTRFAGGDRFDTAVQASEEMWADATPGPGDLRGHAQSVVLSRSDLFADALGGAGLAAHKNGPLLLTATAALTPETENEILRILPKNGTTVYLLGGIAAISPAVENRLRQLGYVTDRLAGGTRYDTAVAIAGQVSTNPTDVLVATGNNFPDALSAGAVAAAYPDTVVLLTDDRVMPAATAAYLNTHELQLNGGVGNTGAHVTTIGGQAYAAFMSSGWRTGNIWYDSHLVGRNRFETSQLVARHFFEVEDGIGVAVGTNWPDALSGGAFMGRVGGPLLLVDPAVGLTDTTDAPIGITQGENAMIDANRGSNNHAFVFGGNAVLPTMVDAQLAQDIQTATGVVQDVR